MRVMLEHKGENQLRLDEMRQETGRHNNPLRLDLGQTRPAQIPLRLGLERGTDLILLRLGIRVGQHQPLASVLS